MVLSCRLYVDIIELGQYKGVCPKISKTRFSLSLYFQLTPFSFADILFVCLYGCCCYFWLRVFRDFFIELQKWLTDYPHVVCSILELYLFVYFSFLSYHWSFNWFAYCDIWIDPFTLPRYRLFTAPRQRARRPWNCRRNTNVCCWSCWCCVIQSSSKSLESWITCVIFYSCMMCICCGNYIFHVWSDVSMFCLLCLVLKI